MKTLLGWLFALAAMLVVIGFATAILAVIASGLLTGAVLAGTYHAILDVHRRRLDTVARDRHNRAALARRCERQNELWRQGDPRGLYGDYPPADREENRP